MPWEINIVCARDGKRVSLGARQSVIDRVAAALPGVVLCPPPLPPPSALEAMSPELRALFLEPQLRAVYDEEGVSFEFFCPDTAEIQCLFVDVRGQGNPGPALARLCLPNGWSVMDAAIFTRLCPEGLKVAEDQARVDLSLPVLIPWADFCGWRDRAVALSGARARATLE